MIMENNGDDAHESGSDPDQEIEDEDKKTSTCLD